MSRHVRTRHEKTRGARSCGAPLVLLFFLPVVLRPPLLHPGSADQGRVRPVKVREHLLQALQSPPEHRPDVALHLQRHHLRPVPGARGLNPVLHRKGPLKIRQRSKRRLQQPVSPLRLEIPPSSGHEIFCPCDTSADRVCFGVRFFQPTPRYTPSFSRRAS